MKKIQFAFMLLGACTMYFIIGGNSNGVFTADYTGNSGLPGSGISCGGSYCHQGIMGVDSNRLRIRVLDAANQFVSSYSVGSTYTIEVRLKTNNSTRAGFQAVAAPFFGSAVAGTANNSLMPTATQSWLNTTSNATYISHTTAGSASQIANGYATWTYQWVAPATDIGAISICVAGNITNANSQPSGDSAVNATYILQKPSALQDVAFAKTISLYPMPAVQDLHLNFDQAINGKAKFTIIGMNGAQIKTWEETIVSNDYKINVNNLSAGFYSLLIASESKNVVKYFSKQ
jgi:hypothetical protein